MGYDFTMHQERQLIARCESTVATLMTTMAAHGYRLERSFDLRDALRDHLDCTCPYHGTARCTCQYVVFLAYEQNTNTPPVVLTVHERDGLTRVRVDTAPLGGPLAWPLLAALDEAETAHLGETV